jgi:hypothetical protein
VAVSVAEDTEDPEDMEDMDGTDLDGTTASARMSDRGVQGGAGRATGIAGNLHPMNQPSLSPPKSLRKT